MFCALSTSKHLHIVFNFTNFTHLMMCDPQPIMRRNFCALGTNSRQSPLLFSGILLSGFFFLEFFFLEFFFLEFFFLEFFFNSYSFFWNSSMDLAYMCVKPQMRLYVCQACPSQTPNAFICVSPNAFICVSPNAFICVSPNTSADATELASLAYLCSLRSHVF